MAMVQSEARIILVALHIGSEFSSFACSRKSRPKDTRPMPLERLCAIYYEPGDAATAKVKSWGSTARTDHQRAVKLKRQQPSEMSEVGTYFRGFVGARESSTALLQKGFTLTQVISDYLRVMGAWIMSTLRQTYGSDVSMNDVEWCVVLAHDWGDHGMELMRTSMERAGLVQSAISSGGSPYPLRFVPELDAASYHCLRAPGGSHIQVASYNCLRAPRGSHIQVGDKILVVDLGFKSCHITVQEVYSVQRSKFEVKQVAESAGNLDGRKQFVQIMIELLVAKMLPVQDNALKVYDFKQFIELHFMDPAEGLWFNIYGTPKTGYTFVLPVIVQNQWEQLDVEHKNKIRNSYDVIYVTPAEFYRAMKPYYCEVAALIAPQLLSTPNIKGILLVGELCNVMNFTKKISKHLNSSVKVVTDVISDTSKGAVAMVLDQVLPFTWKGEGKLSKDEATASSSHGDAIIRQTNSQKICEVLPARGSNSPSLESSNALGGGEASEPSLENKPSNSRVESVVKKYSWDQVRQMTEGLTSRELGKGGFGTVYLGKFENGKEVAVKVLNQSSQEGKLETFVNEVNLLMQVNHMNLVKLLGYCQNERDVVIYEYVEEGSISDHLHGDRRRLNDWKERLNIVLQAACGIEYLHSLCSPRIIHRDIKSENILLTRHMVAKVVDFGISRLMGGDEADNKWRSHLTTRIIGSLGYLDPEYYETGWLKHSSDVYSFGIVLLEMITGRKPVPYPNDASCCIGPWVKRNYGQGGSGAMKAVVDSSLSGNYNPKAMKLVIKLAISCINHSGDNRPKMSEVACVIRKALTMELEEKTSWIPFL